MSCLCFKQKKRVEKEVLDSIFLKTKEFAAIQKSASLDLSKETIDSLRAFVKDKIKTLLDYLENNQRKLKNVGRYLSSISSSSKHPVDHLLSLFILNNILPVIKNFSYDRGDIVKMIKKSAKNSGAKSANLQNLLNKNLAENYLYFEGKMIGVLTHLLTLKMNYSDVIFPYIIETVAIYGNSIPQFESVFGLKTNRQSVIVKILDSEKMLPALNSPENISIQKRIVDGLYGITASNDRKLSIDVKEELISFLYKILVKCEKRTTEAASAHTATSFVDLEKSAFGILMNILKNDFHFYDVTSVQQ